MPLSDLFRRADLLWRRAATGLSFGILFGGGFLMAATLFPILRLAPGTQAERERRVRRAIGRMFRGYLRLLCGLRLIELRIDGAAKLSGAPARIIVANHPTLLDVVILASLFDEIRCVVKEELWRSPWLGGVMRAAGYVSNSLEGAALLETCRRSLTDGCSLMIFPEGTRSPGGRPQRFQRGFANIALLAPADVQPVMLRCDPPTLAKGEPWWMIPPRRPVFEVTVGDRLDTSARPVYEYRAVAAREMVRDLERYYSERLSDAANVAS